MRKSWLWLCTTTQLWKQDVITVELKCSHYWHFATELQRHAIFFSKSETAKTWKHSHKKLFRSYFCCVHSFRMYHCMSFWCLDINKVAIFFKYVSKCVFSSLKSFWYTSYVLTSLQIAILFSRWVQSNLATRNLLANLRLYKSSCTAILICNFTSLLLRSNFNDSSNK